MARFELQMSNRRYGESMNGSQSYVYGNVVTAPSPRPQPQVDQPLPKRKVDPQVKRNRRRAQSLSAGFTLYILAISAITVIICVFYLQLHATNINRTNNVANLRNQLAEMTEQNNAAYHAILNSVNMEEIRLRAIGDMGMIHMGFAQVIEYQNPNSRYVVLHNEIPQTGLLPQSRGRME